MPDGRSNIFTLGLIRYRVEEYAETGDPYLVARVTYFEDEPEDAEPLAERAQEVTSLFVRIARAVRVINDERASLPELPETEPERLSFLIAAAMEIEVEVKQELARDGLHGLPTHFDADLSSFRDDTQLT